VLHDAIGNGRAENLGRNVEQGVGIFHKETNTADLKNGKSSKNG